LFIHDEILHKHIKKSFKPIDSFATTNTKYMYQLEENKKHSTGTHKSTSWGPKPGRFWRCTTATTGYSS
jgi:hypothetical protein